MVELKQQQLRSGGISQPTAASETVPDASDVTSRFSKGSVSTASVKVTACLYRARTTDGATKGRVTNPNSDNGVPF